MITCSTTPQIMIWLIIILLMPFGEAQQRNGPVLLEITKGMICANRSDVQYIYEVPHSGPKNQYTLKVNKAIRDGDTVFLKFDSEASVMLRKPLNGLIKMIDPIAIAYAGKFLENSPFLEIQVFGPATGSDLPYVQIFDLRTEHLCEEPLTGYFDDLIQKLEHIVPESSPIINKACGKRIVSHTGLIVHGQSTKPGDWPWHAAILRFDKSSFNYICGGTLLSATLVLTAAHCATIGDNPIVPNSLSVVLGKHNLIGGDIASQERGVFQIIIHPKFKANTLNDDIALLNLRSEVLFTDYVQPACLWLPDNKLPTEEIFGTVVGWGFNHQDLLSSTLQQITIPIVSELNCLKSNPIFFHKRLNTNKFCAGFANGTAACNGDSGGGLMIFVPDTPGDTSKTSGSWYVRGIVSLTLSRFDAPICDPDQYTIFTDVEKYRDWLSEYLN